MEYWEFLLQQEGDQSWLPLDTAQMEILEGRYRIMAHTSQVDTLVQIQISQRLLDQVPPKRRSLKRQGRTNGDGLLVVMPFTRLRPGTWDIQCSGPLAEQPASDESSSWRYAIQLQVLPPVPATMNCGSLPRLALGPCPIPWFMVLGGDPLPIRCPCPSRMPHRDRKPPPPLPLTYPW